MLETSKSAIVWTTDSLRSMGSAAKQQTNIEVINLYGLPIVKS